MEDYSSEFHSNICKILKQHEPLDLYLKQLSIAFLALYFSWHPLYPSSFIRLSERKDFVLSAEGAVVHTGFTVKWRRQRCIGNHHKV